MALKGKLQDFGITQLLNLINLARKTGTLYLDGPRGQSYLSFREGKLVYASLNGDHASLPMLLQQSGKLTAKQADVIAANMEGKSDREVAMMLIQSGHIQQQDVASSVRQHILRQVYQVFSWKEGSFRFEPADLPLQGKMTTSIALENVIMEGTRRLKEGAHLEEEVPELDVALKFAKRPSTPLRDINLTVEEWRVISFVNPRNTLREIAQSNNMSEYQIRKIAYRLLQAGLVEVVRAPRQAPVIPGSPKVGAKEQEAEGADRRPDVKRGLIHKLINRIREL
jgi:hypothetical protein